MEPTAAADRPQVSKVDSFRCQVDDLVSKTNMREKKGDKVVGFYNCKKHNSGGRKAGGRYAANSARSSHYKGMLDLMCRFARIIREITSHEWAELFLQPVDAVGLQLDDYHKIITKPMDLSTIQDKIKGKDHYYRKVQRRHINQEAPSPMTRIVCDGRSIKYDSENSRVCDLRRAVFSYE